MTEVASNPFLQYGALGLLAIVLFWVGNSILTRILDQSFVNQNKISEQLGVSIDKLSIAFDKLDLTLDRISERTANAASNAELAAEKRHAQMLAALESSAKETRHDIRSHLTELTLKSHDGRG